MGWLTWFLFESLAALGAVLGLVLFVLLVYWRRSGRRRPLLVGLAAAAVLLTVQGLVVTQREHAGRILVPIEKDLLASRTGALAAALAPDFDAAGMDRDAFVQYVSRQLQRLKIRWLDRWALFLVESDAERFVVSATYSADVAGGNFTGNVRSVWSLTFVRRSDGWKIANIRPLHVGSVDDPTWFTFD